MKKKNLFILFILSALFCTDCFSSENNDNSSFKDLLNQIIGKVENNVSSDRLMTGIAELERLNAMYPDKWITDYYISLYEIQQSFTNLSGDNHDLLDDAFNHIEKLKHDKTADQSEVSTIEGYYFYALVASNPTKNGQVYYKNVLDSYNKALKINPSNPRAKLLLLMFESNMAGFTGNKELDLCNRILEIEELYKKETNDYIQPTWGKKSLDRMKEKFCNNK